MGCSFEVVHDWLCYHNLLSNLSENEQTILKKLEKGEVLDEQDFINLGWYVESLWALLWAGSHIDNLNPEIPVDDSLVNLVPNIEKNESGLGLMSRTKKRSYTELYKMLDLYYRSHWFARDGRLNGYDTGNFDLSIIHFRRQALEWIIDNSSDWDEVDLST